MEDDLEYFISFPAPKPYVINDFNEKPIESPSASIDGALYKPFNNDYCSTSNAEELFDSSSFLTADNIKIITNDSDSEENISDEETGIIPALCGSSAGREPVVLLLGWMGASDKHLAKYAALYTAKGCICVRYTAPPSFHYFSQPTSYMAPLAEKLVGVLRDMHLHTHPIFCHSFSNHGATLYYFISDALEKDNARAREMNEHEIRVHGCIFDSCPAPTKALSGALAVYSIIDGPVVLKLVSAMGAWLYLMGWSFLSLVSTIITGRLSTRLPWALVQECRRVPQLFLYSAADSLINYTDVESFMAERKKLGVKVCVKKWKDSPHVQHFRCYPREYSGTVFQFLSQCLQESVQQKPTSLPLEPISMKQDACQKEQSRY